jgi:CRISPR-associated protein Csh2
MQEKGNDIFVREVIYDKEGHIQDAKLRAADYLPDDLDKLKTMPAEEQKQFIAKSILNTCIDIRLFGATIPLDLKVADGSKIKSVTSSITWTGPIQFKMGKSLHSVKILHIKGTGAFASGAGATQKTFREEDILPYSLIGFYGIVNENAAKHTNLMQEDIKLLKEAIWNGTKGLISRSKFGQMPRLLLVINYKQPDFFIGDLDNLICLKSDKRDEQLRKPEDYRIDITELMGKINEHNDKIENVEFSLDERMSFVLQEKEVKLKDLDKFQKISL